MTFHFAIEYDPVILPWLKALLLDVSRVIMQILQNIKELNPTWVVAGFAFAQWFIARNNHRLSLYNRRFEVYSSFLSLKIWLDRYDGSGESETKKEDVNAIYLKSLREAQFLFDPRDNVQGLLDEAWRIHFREYSWRRKCNFQKARGDQPLSTAECERLSKEFQDHEADSKRLEEIADILEGVLEQYLRFGQIGRKTLVFWQDKLKRPAAPSSTL